MERDVREFLEEFSSSELVALEVLSPSYTYLLQGENVAPLVKLMLDKGVTKLVSTDREWYLTVEGKFRDLLPSEVGSGLVEGLFSLGRVFTVEVIFRNPRSRESLKSGLVKELRHTGNVFMSQNPHINPHY